jgi:hypothetical protein
MALDGFSLDVRSQVATALMSQGWGVVRSVATKKAQEIALHMLQGTPLGEHCPLFHLFDHSRLRFHSRSGVQHV